MTDNEFEKLWNEKRERILSNNEEYQKIKKSYTGWNFTDYLLLIGGFVICENYIATFSLPSVLRYLLAGLGMMLIWLGYRLLKARLGSKRTLEEVEQEVKQQYRNSL